jgi:hypothetical protein
MDDPRGYGERGVGGDECRRVTRAGRSRQYRVERAERCTRSNTARP